MCNATKHISRVETRVHMLATGRAVGRSGIFGDSHMKLEPTARAVRRTIVGMTRQRARRFSSAVAVLIMAAAGMLSGCGSPDQPAPTTAPASSRATPTVSEQALTGELGYFRSGGIAGFRDQLIVSPDGTAVLERAGSEVARCKVKPEPLGHLAQLQSVAVKSVPKPGDQPQKMPPAHADRMTVGLVLGGTRIPSTAMDSTPPEWDQLMKVMSTLFSETVAFASSGPSMEPNSMCEPI